MSVYFSLVGLTLIIPLALTFFVKNKKNRELYTLMISMFLVFLVVVLRAPSVGKDIMGYKRIYENMQYQTWKNFDTTWMEWGYELLMMIFTHIFHASFQTFLVVIYAFVYYSYFNFFRKYSVDYTMSILLYICFTFFTFDLSALRTVLGLAICLLAIPYAQKKGFVNFLVFVAITLAAAQIHKSAYIFLVLYFAIKFDFNRKTAIFYIGLPLLLFIFKGHFFGIINVYFKSVEESKGSIGGNLIIYICSILMTGIIWLNIKSNQKKIMENVTVNENNRSKFDKITKYLKSSGFEVRMVYLGIVLQLFAGNTILSRMGQYAQIFILLLLPNNIKQIDWRSRVIVKYGLIILVILYFWKYSLDANALGIVPYKFFWSE